MDRYCIAWSMSDKDQNIQKMLLALTTKKRKDDNGKKSLKDYTPTC
jgi:hypothetical protein